MSHLLGWLALVPLGIAVGVFWFLLRSQERTVVVEYEDARGRRRRIEI